MVNEPELRTITESARKSVQVALSKAKTSSDVKIPSPEDIYLRAKVLSATTSKDKLESVLVEHMLIDLGLKKKGISKLVE